MRLTAASAILLLTGCAASQGGLLKNDLISSFASSKAAGVVAACVQQGLNGGPMMGTDGTNYWVTRQSAFGPAVRYDFKPAASGSTVEYRSRLRVNNGLDKVKACL